MRVLAFILMANMVLGAFMALYLVVIWQKCKNRIAAHGWNVACADPICGNMWAICFVPIVGIMYYLIAGEAIGILSVTDKARTDGIVRISYGPLTINYDEDHQLDG